MGSRAQRRRPRMQRSAGVRPPAALVVMGVIAALLAACSPPSPAPGPTGSPTPLTAAPSSAIASAPVPTPVGTPAPWSLAAGAPTPAGTNDRLAAVACVAGPRCWAVGDRCCTDLRDIPLAEEFDGGAWTAVPAARGGADESDELSGVACVDASDCWAVGFVARGAGLSLVTGALVEHWDGRRWSTVPNPSGPSADGSQLTGVTCAGAADCWAVGSVGVVTQSVSTTTSAGTTSTSTEPQSGTRLLIEHWDGSGWGLDSIPAGDAGSPVDTVLDGVACAGARSCWAVGSQGTAGGEVDTLVEHFDGVGWTAAPAANPASGPRMLNELRAVACAGGSGCWAVGRATRFSGASVIGRPLVERLEGGGWVEVASADLGAADDQVLLGVACAAAERCVGVGHHHPGAGDRALAEESGQGSWVATGVPAAGGDLEDDLAGVACTPQGACAGVGFSVVGSFARPLIDEEPAPTPPR